MRTICDACESAAAALFCAADEAALCRLCDHKVHTCNKLASKHVRVGLNNPLHVPPCDTCENSPAFFYCEVDGTSLCLQCDTMVHVEGKKTHLRYLLLRQRVEFPGDKPGQPGDFVAQFQDSAVNTREYGHSRKRRIEEDQTSHTTARFDAIADRASTEMGSGMIDLNTKPT